MVLDVELRIRGKQEPENFRIAILRSIVTWGVPIGIDRIRVSSKFAEET